MRLSIITLILVLILNISCNAPTEKPKTDFMWGVASAAYQVEGAYQADGKGLSNWDVYTNKNEVTKATIGKNHTGNDAIHQYDRTVYLEDIKLMKKLGINAYRFSLAWTRILPQGIGKTNAIGIEHYQQFVNDLLDNGIEPLVTLYHWDMPQALVEKGGMSNPNFPTWFENYANIIFKAFGKKVKHYITFNEPSIENFLIEPIAQNIANKKEAFTFSNEQLAGRANFAHNLMIAHAKTVLAYKALNLGGKIGITLALIPTQAKDEKNTKDIAAANLLNQIYNEWFLDAALLGTYPNKVLDLYKKYNPTFKISEAEMVIIKSAKSDFLGVNYYGVTYVNDNPQRPFNIEWSNPDSIKMFNGAVRPKAFYNLLVGIKNKYNNPEIIITENGAGYGDTDEKITQDTVNDVLRTQYVEDHIKAVLDAKKNGVNLTGYFLWSMCDNFEWVSGYDRRFGIVFIDFATQKRIPKQSYYKYKDIIKMNQ